MAFVLAQQGTGNSAAAVFYKLERAEIIQGGCLSAAEHFYPLLGEAFIPIGQVMYAADRSVAKGQGQDDVILLVAPVIRQGQKVLIAAHGNSLRALVKYLDHIPETDIVELNIPTGMPLVYELDDNLQPLNRYYLGDPEKVKAAMEAVAAQGKKK